MDSRASATYQVAAKTYDEDTALLTVRLTDGAEFCVTNAGHARTVLKRLGHHGEVSTELRHWLERYRLPADGGAVDKERLVARLGMLRVELKTKR